MKKAWLVVALVALGGLAANTFADVQNIRLSGDTRLRGYYLNNAGDNAADDGFIAQRTRVSVEADLEDHVLVVATMSAENLWGGGGSGANLSGVTVSDEIGLVEGYVQMNEVFYSAATLKLGRQYLHYGHGLIISSVEQEYNYDAARLVMDYYPLTIDVVASKLVSGSGFGAPFGTPRDVNMFFVNARYEMSDSLIKNIEGYLGYQAVSGSGFFAPPSPLIVGIRSDMNLTEGLNTYAEVAYEFGDQGGFGVNEISAWLMNVGGKYTINDAKSSPTVNASWTYASGGAGGSGHNFVPWFDYVDGYNGYLFAPFLSNIHIFNLGAAFKTAENTTLSIQGYYYLKADSDGGAGSNGAIDFGGIGAGAPAGSSTFVGMEVDAILGYDYSKDVHCQLVYAAFVPGTGIHNTSGFDAVAHEIRGEINVKF